MRRSCYGVIRDHDYVYWPARPASALAGAVAPKAPGDEVRGKKECLNLTNEAIMLLKTKDRENERSQTNPILCGAKRPLLLHGFGHPAKRHRKVELVQTHLDKGQ